MNSSVLENRLRKSVIVKKAGKENPNIETLADLITLRVLSRRATPQEKQLYKEYMEQNNLPITEAAIDITWMQMNSNEFLYNH